MTNICYCQSQRLKGKARKEAKARREADAQTEAKKIETDAEIFANSTSAAPKYTLSLKVCLLIHRQNKMGRYTPG